MDTSDRNMLTLPGTSTARGNRIRMFLHFLFPASVCLLATVRVEGFTFGPSQKVLRGAINRSRPVHAPRFANLSVLSAKKRKKESEDFSWYDGVDDDDSPDDIFWQEMERQKLINQLSSNPDAPGVGDIGSFSVGGSPGATSYVAGGSASKRAPGLTVDEERSADATLASFKPYMVSDNWLDERYAGGAEMNGAGSNLGVEEPIEDDVWDHWVTSQDGDDSNSMGIKLDAKRLMAIPELEQYRVPYEGLDEDEVLDAEEDMNKRLSLISLTSQRLENARDNSKARAYFSREPDRREGFDRMWVSAIDNPCMKNLVGVFRDYGVQFADNFGDFEDQSTEDGQGTIQDIAAYKARKVYEVTGLPCIASRTSFEVEPARPSGGIDAPGRLSNVNPKVVTGYRFNDVGEHVDYLCEVLKGQSDPTRITRFRTCICFYDGEMTIFDYGECDCDIFYASSLRTFIPMSSAINEMSKTLQLTFGLEYQGWIRRKQEDAMRGKGGVALKLRDRVLKEAKVLPNRIIDVSSFMDSQIDINLMDECAKELANRFVKERPTKILTVATTGLVIAIPMAKYLNVPCVYARKERNVVMADTFKANYSSKTVGKNRELLVSTKHLGKDDDVLIVDDFLSSGASQDALLRIISDSGATPVGIAVLMEKVYDSGRQSLSGYNIPVESLVGVTSVSEGVIRLREEEGVDDIIGDI